jgi:hypothetical protein
VSPALVEATRQTKHPLEKRDAAFHTRAKRLRVSEERILFALGFGGARRPFFAIETISISSSSCSTASRSTR